jgi:hypothetical protein
LGSEVDTTNIGTHSIAIGKAQASGMLSYARGGKSGSTYVDGATALGNASTAVGINSKASGMCSLSYGFLTEAAGNYSAAVGLGVEA